MGGDCEEVAKQIQKTHKYLDVKIRKKGYDEEISSNWVWIVKDGSNLGRERDSSLSKFAGLRSMLVIIIKSLPW